MPIFMLGQQNNTPDYGSLAELLDRVEPHRSTWLSNKENFY